MGNGLRKRAHEREKRAGTDLGVRIPRQYLVGRVEYPTPEPWSTQPAVPWPTVPRALLAPRTANGGAVLVPGSPGTTLFVFTHPSSAKWEFYWFMIRAGRRKMRNEAAATAAQAPPTRVTLMIPPLRGRAHSRVRGRPRQDYATSSHRDQRPQQDTPRSWASGGRDPKLRVLNKGAGPRGPARTRAAPASNWKTGSGCCRDSDVVLEKDALATAISGSAASVHLLSLCPSWRATRSGRACWCRCARAPLRRST